jgi:hypothetical protein
MEEHSMVLLALLSVLFFVMLVVGGIWVNAYLYAHGALHGGKIRRGRRPSLGTASFSQTATLPTSAAASDLYYGGIGVQNEDRASLPMRRFILYTLAILISLVVLAVLMLGATQF